MANNRNLIPRTSPQVRGRKGGIASGIARRRQSAIYKRPNSTMFRLQPGFTVLFCKAMFGNSISAIVKVLKIAAEYPGGSTRR